MLGTVYQSDTEFKAALRDSIGATAAKEYEGALIKSAAQMNAKLILDWYFRFCSLICDVPRARYVGAIFGDFPQPVTRCRHILCWYD